MSTVTVELPEALHRTLQEIAAREGFSMNQFMASAAAEKLSAFLTIDHLRREAALASREDFEKFLSMVPGRPVPETDRLPEDYVDNA